MIVEMVVALGLALPGQSPALRSATAMLTESGIEWRTTGAAPLRVHAAVGSLADAASGALRVEATEALTHVLDVLGEADAPSLDLFYIGSEDTMEGLVGARPKALSVPRAYLAVFVHTRAVRPHHRHELTHVLAGHFWGPAAAPAHWINEGLAQYAAEACGGFDLDPLAASLVSADRSIPPSELVYAFGAQPRLEANVLAGSFVGFLMKTHGRAAVEALWRHGVARFEALFRIGFDQAYGDWLSTLARTPFTGVDLESLQENGCG